MRMYEEVLKCKNEKEIADILSDITWGCGDCSPDSKKQCKECLETLLAETRESIICS